MTRGFVPALGLMLGVVLWSKCSGVDPADSVLEYLSLDAPKGMSQAVVVQGEPLVHTRQLLPLDRDGKLVGQSSGEEQIDQVLDNLDAVLTDSGSSLNQLVRLNVYAIAQRTVDQVRQRLSERDGIDVRPAITAVLTPLSRRGALLAVDAVAVASDQGQAVALRRCKAIDGRDGFADVGVLPRGGVAYLSGVPAEGGLVISAVDKSISILQKTLAESGLTTQDVVRLKVFLRPAASASEVLNSLQEHFPGQLIPPVVFVEWLAPPPVEIELIARLPFEGTAAPTLEYYDPPEVRPMQIFSRVALVRTQRQIYISSLYARQEGSGQEQALDVFDQLQSILEHTGSDLRHMAKATYYVYDDDSARGMDRARLWLYDQDRAPAASKCLVHGIAQPKRTLTLDMIAVEK